jgi:hypothetical protein
LIGCLCLMSFFAAFGKDEGTLGDRFIPNLLADIFIILRFPLHSLLWPIMDVMHATFRQISGLLFFICLFGNCLFYALLLERAFYFTLKAKRARTNELNNGA